MQVPQCGGNLTELVISSVCGALRLAQHPPEANDLLQDYLEDRILNFHCDTKG